MNCIRRIREERRLAFSKNEFEIYFERTRRAILTLKFRLILGASVHYKLHLYYPCHVCMFDHVPENLVVESLLYIYEILEIVTHEMTGILTRITLKIL